MWLFSRKLFVPVHVQRWTVLHLYCEHGRCVNCSRTARLYQR